MFIPEFLCGVLVTLGIEIILLFIYVIYVNTHDDKKDESD